MAGDLIKNVKVQKGHVPKMFDASTSTWRPAGGGGGLGKTLT